MTGNVGNVSSEAQAGPGDAALTVGRAGDRLLRAQPILDMAGGTVPLPRNRARTVPGLVAGERRG